jgi:hypothetical protein
VEWKHEPTAQWPEPQENQAPPKTEHFQKKVEQPPASVATPKPQPPFSRVNRHRFKAAFILSVFAFVFGCFGGLHPFYGEGRAGLVFQEGLGAGFALWLVTTGLMFCIWLLFRGVKGLLTIIKKSSSR